MQKPNFILYLGILIVFPVASLIAACGDSDGVDSSSGAPTQAAQTAPESLDQTADRIVAHMTTREKIGQKLMMAFRYWCPDDAPACTTGMTDLPEAASQALRDNGIGGVILFGNNLTGLEQTRRLTAQIREARRPDSLLGLLIGTDEEGGNVFRLPRVLATSMPGNMALGAAYQATHDGTLASDSGRVLAEEIRAVGLNVNFAPVVDVNSNPANPVINVRAYGDDAADVAVLGSLSADGMRAAGVVSAFKHFPGHGDTSTDSHYGLPVVGKSRADADAIDLAPYRQAIQSGHAPDMIMTAHIQYPALDATTLATRTGEAMIAPATMSRRIQHDLLRGRLGYRGVTVTDALDMQGITDFFEPADAVVKVFQADVDIALMPVEIRTAATAGKLSQLIDQLAAAVDDGRISRSELDESVGRIVRMKLHNRITPSGDAAPLPALDTIGSAPHREIENRVTRESITLLRNRSNVLPLRVPAQRIFILTPWGEQAEAMRRRFGDYGYGQVTGAKLSTISWEAQQQAIDASDLVIVGTMASGYTPAEGATAGAVMNEMQQMRRAMAYAKNHGKTLIHVALRAPYDVLGYDDLADATFATYSYYGYENGLRGPSLPVFVDMMTGAARPMGKLPVEIRAAGTDGALGPVRYARGFGLTY